MQAMIVTPQTTDLPTAIYARDGGLGQPSVLARSPWDARAQHGGAPSALLVHLAESAMTDPGWQLTRLSMELIKPVPVAPLAVRQQLHAARSTTRMTLELYADDMLVAQAHALLLRGQPFALPAQTPGWTAARLLPLPQDCSQRLRIPGLPEGTAVHTAAVEGRVDQGDPSQPGAAAAWFRPSVTLVLRERNAPATSRPD